ncbi:MAG: RNA methyltransferase [Bdellovibrionales bacterium]|nr:RNA methyltransferase [Bdellovibrionales bacterium]
MNSLLLFPGEEVVPGEYCVCGERLRYLREFHALRVGEYGNVLIYRHGQGSAELVEVGLESCRFRVDVRPVPERSLPIDFLVGLSRPQILKKVLQYAAMMRIRSLAFFPSELGEKSYLNSKVRRPESQMRELVKGMEQIRYPYAPGVSLYPTLEEALRQNQNRGFSGEARFILADPSAQSTLFEGLYQGNEENHSSLQFVVALGPEPGWSRGEVERFESSGFRSYGLSPDHYRVEVAMVALISQILPAC